MISFREMIDFLIDVLELTQAMIEALLAVLRRAARRPEPAEAAIAA